MKQIAIVSAFVLSGCVPWYYVGPDLSDKTIGPIVLTKHMIDAVKGCEDAIGCFVPSQAVMYLRDDASLSNGVRCRLPKKEPRSIEEHEWCHVEGWSHP